MLTGLGIVCLGLGLLGLLRLGLLDSVDLVLLEVLVLPVRHLLAHVHSHTRSSHGWIRLLHGSHLRSTDVLRSVR